jgi:signal transduction histidine kinase
MLVLASPPRALCASSIAMSDRSVLRGVSGRLSSALSRIMGWTRATPRPPDGSRTHDVGASDRDDAALIAHDCLTLLAVMGRCADAMRHPGAEDDFVEFHRAADRMDHVLRQLIAPRRAEMAAAEAIEIGQLVAESEGMLKRAVAPGVTLRLQPGAVGFALIRVRRWDLERILLQVVISASRGFASGDVVMETSSHGNVGSSVSLIVTGSGSALASSTPITSRLSSSGHDERDLGLAVVARLVQRLDGVLQFESDSQRRTRIQIDLPLAPSAVEDNRA